MNRRTLLAGLGLGTASALVPATPVWAGVAPPKRLVVFLTAQGCVPHRWRCDPMGLGDVDWQQDWTTWPASAFSDSLRPLYPWRHHLTAVGGLGMVSAVAEGRDTQHKLSIAHALTGARAQWSNALPLGGAASFDQLVAAEIARPDAFRSVESAVGGGMLYQGMQSAVFSGPGQPLPPIHEERALWDRVFGGLGAGSAQDLLRAVHDRYATVSDQLSGTDRESVAHHRDLVERLVARAAGFANASCALDPARPERDHDRFGDDIATHLDAHLDVLVAALACDLTRVVTIQGGQLRADTLGYPGRLHLDYAHAIYDDPIAEQVMVDYAAYYAQRFARLLEALDAVPEAGGTLLDHTLVVWMSELADSWHGYDQYPVVLAGGAHSGVRLGQYVNYAASTPIDPGVPGGSRRMGLPHNRLLVTLCRAMGVTVPSVGLSTVPGWDGTPVDLSAPLSALLA